MLEYFAARPNAKTVPLFPVTPSSLKKWLTAQPKKTRRWVEGSGFDGASGRHCAIPTFEGSVQGVLVGVGGGSWSWAALARRLPQGRYFIDGDIDRAEAEAAALGWALGAYEFTRYRKRKSKPATLVWPDSCDRGKVSRLAVGIGLTRDLINTPAGDMGPEQLATAARKLARLHSARCTIIEGDALLDKKYPAIHAVGRACDQAPRLVDIKWGNPKHKKLTLVGKGVCFDTGGLDLKSAGNMKLMKKDMGGAATVLGLAHAVMDAKLPVRLRVLVPAVENSVAGNAYHPLDVLQTRKGLTVEVGNTDAEGRIILCDALAEADSEKPDLIIDMATLTGAARVALGTELPALFSSNDEAAAQLLSAGVDSNDRLWRLPLHDAYRHHLDSKVADINNIANTSYGGAITAALFLREFVSKGQPWIHIDTMAWNSAERAGRPQGGDAPALRALYTMLERRYQNPPERSTKMKKKAVKKKAVKKKAVKKKAVKKKAVKKKAVKKRAGARKTGASKNAGGPATKRARKR